MNLFALDFDGVICDSARETALSAWRAGAAFWSEWRNIEPDSEYLARFVHLRPYLETGYQAVLMIRMIADRVPDEVFRDHLVEHCEELMVKHKTTRDELVYCFGQARDAWMADDLDGWLGANTAFPGTVERVRGIMEKTPVFILTTKQERFAHALLAAWGIPFPADRLFGLESGRRKEELLQDFVESEEWGGSDIHFVEDRVETLLRIADCSDLDAVRLYYATWGYGTPEHLAVAQKHSRITVWNAEDFLNV